MAAPAQRGRPSGAYAASPFRIRTMSAFCHGPRLRRWGQQTRSRFASKIPNWGHHCRGEPAAHREARARNLWAPPLRRALYTSAGQSERDGNVRAVRQLVGKRGFLHRVDGLAPAVFHRDPIGVVGVSVAGVGRLPFGGVLLALRPVRAAGDRDERASVTEVVGVRLALGVAPGEGAALPGLPERDPVGGVEAARAGTRRCRRTRCTTGRR